MVICVQFSPKLQHLIPHDLPYAKDSFEALQHNGSKWVDNSSIIQFFQKLPFSSKRTIWALFAPKIFDLISHDLPQILFWNIFAWWDTLDWQSLHWSVFLRNPLLTQLSDLGTIWAKIIQPYIPGSYLTWFTL